MNKLIALCCCFFLAFPLIGQDPSLTEQTGRAPTPKLELILAPQDNGKLKEAELRKRRKGRAPEFAINIPVNISPQTHGVWTEEEGGMLQWQLKISSPTAHSLNLGFTRFFMPEGASLIIEDIYKQVHGPFTPQDNEAHASLWTPIIPGDQLQIVIKLPVYAKDNLDLHLSFVNHDFINIGKVLSGACNLDVVCGQEDGWSELDNYRDIMQSVGVITVEGNRLCTGFLVNNEQQDCTPYLMTAYHCEITRSSAPSTVVYWNYENSFCRTVNSFDSGRSGDGQFDIFNSGAVHLASWEQTDFTLLLLDDPVNTEANAYFAGWSNSPDSPTDGALCIHHPNTQEKRISISNEALYTSSWGSGSTMIPNGDHLIVPSWWVGTTEDGSSGAPLFNKNKEVIGQLHGGRASCENRDYDSFGSLHRSWKGGGSPSTSLKDWLDPRKTGLSRLTGKWASYCEIAIISPDLRLSTCVGDTAQFDLSASEAFTGLVEFSIEHLPPNMNAEFSSSSVMPGMNTQLKIIPDASIDQGIYEFEVLARDETNSTSLTLSLEINKAPNPFSFIDIININEELPLALRFEWTNSSNAQFYKLFIAKDEAFNDIVDQKSTTNNYIFYSAPEFETTYYWKLEAFNSCGSTTAGSGGRFKTLPDLRVDLLSPVEINCVQNPIRINLLLGPGYKAPAKISYTLDPPIEGLEVNYNQNPDNLSIGEVLEVELSRKENFKAGDYKLTFEVEDELNQGRSNINLDLIQAPKPVMLTIPTNNSVVLSHELHFSWSPVKDGLQNYRFELSKDRDFTQLLITDELNISDYYTRLAQGNYYWRVQSINECGSSYSEVNSFRIQVQNLQELNGNKLAIEPNPSSGNLYIHFERPLTKGEIEVLNLQGQLLQKQAIPEGQLDYQIELSNYPNAVYLLRIKERKSSTLKRIILQKN